MDNSLFLCYIISVGIKNKKELAEYGYEVGKISMKEKTVVFRKLSSAGKKGEKR